MQNEVVKSYLDNLYAMNYKEKPVDILEFICKPQFLGTSTDGGKAIYEIWKIKLKDIFMDDRRFLVVFTGSIGTGKTFISYIGVAYIMYRIMCLKDPWNYFRLAEAGKMSIAFFNLTKSLSASKGFQMLQTLLMRSQWFKDHGGVVRGTTDPYVDLPLFSYTLASPYSRGFGTVGENVICAVMDEVDSPTESEKQKVRILKAYEATVNRFTSRFVVDDKTLARFFLIASKQDELSFIEAFVEQMKNSGKIFVVDIPLWEAKPAAYYCGNKFSVMVGDTYTHPRILNNEAEILQARKDGFKVVDVPTEYRENFERDLISALRDIAGVSVKGIRKSKLFPSERFLVECYDASKQDPISLQTIEVGLNDDIHLLRFMDLSKLRQPKSTARYIHCDIALSGDALGLACSHFTGWAQINVEKEDGTLVPQKAPIIETEWLYRIKARTQDSIPLHKVRKLILDLVAIGFNIAKVTIDLRLASEDTRQLLIKAGVNADYFSVDKDIQAYMNFKNLVFEKRWLCHRHEYLHFELKNLEFDRNAQKVDHPNVVKDIEFLEDGGVKDYVMAGSKDLADAVCGSVMQAILSMPNFMDTSDMVRILKGMNDSPGLEKDPFWFVNADKTDPGKKVLGSGATAIDIAKQADILKKLNLG